MGPGSARRLTATQALAGAVGERVGVFIPPEVVIALLTAVVQLVYACHPQPVLAADWLNSAGPIRRWWMRGRVYREWRRMGGDDGPADAICAAVVQHAVGLSADDVAGLYADQNLEPVEWNGPA